MFAKDTLFYDHDYSMIMKSQQNRNELLLMTRPGGVSRVVEYKVLCEQSDVLVFGVRWDLQG